MFKWVCGGHGSCGQFTSSLVVTQWLVPSVVVMVVVGSLLLAWLLLSGQYQRSGSCGQCTYDTVGCCCATCWLVLVLVVVVVMVVVGVVLVAVCGGGHGSCGRSTGASCDGHGSCGRSTGASLWWWSW